MKKGLFLSSTLIAATIVASGVLAYAATSSDGIATGSNDCVISDGQSKNTVWTSTPSNIQNYSVAKFPGYSSYERTSNVQYGYSSLTAYAPIFAGNHAYGQHGYLYNGPRVFDSFMD